MFLIKVWEVGFGFGPSQDFSFGSFWLGSFVFNQGTLFMFQIGFKGGWSKTLRKEKKGFSNRPFWTNKKKTNATGNAKGKKTSDLSKPNIKLSKKENV